MLQKDEKILQLTKQIRELQGTNQESLSSKYASSMEFRVLAKAPIGQRLERERSRMNRQQEPQSGYSSLKSSRAIPAITIGPIDECSSI
jgi:hypothetical protein